VANTPASHLRSEARAVDYLHRAFDVIPEVDATSALCEFGRMRREGQLYNSHEAFVNEVAMFAELRRARPRWGANKHEWLRWRQWARRYRNEPFSAELGPHNVPPGARGTHYTFPAGSDNVCLAPSPGATRPGVPSASSVAAHHLPHRLPHTIHRAPAGPLFEKEGMLLRPVAQLYGRVRTDWNQCFVIDCSLSHPAGHKLFTRSHNVLRNT